jgi:hypothetical protein
VAQQVEPLEPHLLPPLLYGVHPPPLGLRGVNWIAREREREREIEVQYLSMRLSVIRIIRYSAQQLLATLQYKT